MNLKSGDKLHSVGSTAQTATRPKPQVRTRITNESPDKPRKVFHSIQKKASLTSQDVDEIMAKTNQTQPVFHTQLTSSAQAFLPPISDQQA